VRHRRVTVVRRDAQRLAHDGLEIRVQPAAEARQRTARLRLQHFDQRGATPRAAIRQLAGEQFVEQHAERVDVAAGVNVVTAHRCLFRTHVGQCAEELMECR